MGYIYAIIYAFYGEYPGNPENPVFYRGKSFCVLESNLSQRICDPPEEALVARQLAAVEPGLCWPYIRAVVAKLVDSRPSRA